MPNGRAPAKLNKPVFHEKSKENPHNKRAESLRESPSTVN